MWPTGIQLIQAFFFVIYNGNKQNDKMLFILFVNNQWIDMKRWFFSKVSFWQSSTDTKTLNRQLNVLFGWVCMFFCWVVDIQISCVLYIIRFFKVGNRNRRHCTIPSVFHAHQLKSQLISRSLIYWVRGNKSVYILHCWLPTPNSPLWYTQQLLHKII